MKTVLRYDYSPHHAGFRQQRRERDENDIQQPEDQNDPDPCELRHNIL